MRRLLNREVAPPVDAEGWSFRFVHPETGRKSAGNSYWSWMEAVKEHIRANNLPKPDNLAAICEDQLCGTLPPHLCVYESGDPPPTDTRIDFSSVVDWLKAIGTKIISGEPYVEQAESERRAAICVACPYNVVIVGGCGGGCKKLAEFFTPGMAKLQTKQDSRLRSCAICKCYNSIAVHFPLQILEHDDTPERQADYPEHCWKSKQSVNYKP